MSSRLSEVMNLLDSLQENVETLLERVSGMPYEAPKAKSIPTIVTTCPRCFVDFGEEGLADHFRYTSHGSDL